MHKTTALLIVAGALIGLAVYATRLYAGLPTARTTDARELRALERQAAALERIARVMEQRPRAD